MFLHRFLLTLALCITVPVSAATFELVVPNPPGGTTDIVGRYVAKILNDSNVSTVVQNRAGAQGTIGTKSVATTANVQNTLLILGTGPGLYAPLMMDPAPYRVQQDFEIISTIASDSIVIIVPGNSKIASARDLVKQIKSSQTPLRYAHGAMSQRFAGILFLDLIKGTATDVPFNGSAPAVLAVASNQLEFGFVNYTDAKELAKAGRVRIIGIASKNRHPGEPNIRTFKEQGINFEQQAWFTLAAPRGMDATTRRHLHAIVTNAMNHDKTSFVATEMTLMPGTQADAKNFIDQQYKVYQPKIEKFRQTLKN